MIKKDHIAYFLFTIMLLYIISPWYLEKGFLLNEFLSLSGLALLAYKKFRFGNDYISICILLLLSWGGFHLFTSVFRADSIYFYLRNSVIIYSIFTYFIGYFAYKYLTGYLAKILTFLRAYILFFLFVPISVLFFERFGMSTLFPLIGKKLKNKWMLPTIIILNFIYSFTYNSATAIFLTLFYLFLLATPGYKFFKQTVIVGFICFTAFFIYIQPNLELVANRFSPYSDEGILDVRRSNKLLAVDPNSTWRLVFWNQIIVDHFPGNLFGLGFGTPMMKYYPVEDAAKIPTLPYVLGAHNSFVYLFGRLGLIYIIITLAIYRKIFKEYFYSKTYYYNNKTILIFWSFFAITIISAFNPTLETPIFSGLYWFLLGLLSKAICNKSVKPSRNQF